MRKYRAEQIMRWLDIRDGWRLCQFERRAGKRVLLDLFLMRQERMKSNDTI